MKLHPLGVVRVQTPAGSRVPLRGTLSLLRIVVGIGLVACVAGCGDEQPQGSYQAVPDGDGAAPEVTAVANWGPAVDGVRTKLSALGDGFAVGKPMKFRLEMRHEGDQQSIYDDQSVDINDKMIVIGPDGKRATYILGGEQTSARRKLIKPKEVVVLFASLDLSEQYHIGIPGQYKVQFGGDGPAFGAIRFPPSNVIRIDVKPGSLTTLDVMVGRLVPLRPEGWWFHKGRTGKFVDFTRRSGRLEGYGVRVWLTDRVYEAGLEGRSEYLGRCDLGHAYFLAGERARAAWPEFREQITAALKIGQGQEP